MDTPTEDTHANNGRAFVSECMVLKVQQFARIDEVFTCRCIHSFLGLLFPLLKLVDDVIDDVSTNPRHTLVALVEVFFDLIVGLNREAENDLIQSTAS